MRPLWNKDPGFLDKYSDFVIVVVAVLILATAVCMHFFGGACG